MIVKMLAGKLGLLRKFNVILWPPPKKGQWRKANRRRG
jgi:hypothetical protein